MVQRPAADYSPVKGLHGDSAVRLRIWELIQQALDKRFKATGHVNASSAVYLRLLHKGAEHVEGFAHRWPT